MLDLGGGTLHGADRRGLATGAAVAEGRRPIKATPAPVVVKGVGHRTDLRGPEGTTLSPPEKHSPDEEIVPGVDIRTW